MKKPILLETFGRPPAKMQIPRAAARRFDVLQSKIKCQLDHPPQGDLLLQLLNHKPAFTRNESRPSHPQRILVAEDEAGLRQIYAQMLVRDGYLVAVAEDGETAWNTLQAASLGPNGFDLLITDNNMPRLTGVELIQKLRFTHLEVPVILASGEIPEEADRLHIAAILPKPVPLDRLMQTVREVLHAVRNAHSNFRAGN